MINKYFRHPLLYDYLIAVSLCFILYVLYIYHKIHLPSIDNSLSTTTDLSTIALTLAGFVLTLLTVLITFKAGAKIPNLIDNDDTPLFDIFFSTPLYYRTTELLKDCIKSLIFVSILGFALKIFLTEPYVKYIFFSNVLGLIIIFTTLLRSLKILTNIIDLQKRA